MQIPVNSMGGMMEWTKLPRSIRLIAHDVALDVWPICTANGREYQFTVLDNRTGHYLATGTAMSQDSACELAMKAGRI